MVEIEITCQQRFLTQHRSLLLYTFVLAIPFFIALTNVTLTPNRSEDRYHLSLYLSSILDFSSVIFLTAVISTGSFLSEERFARLYWYYLMSTWITTLLLLLTTGSVCWTLWELSYIHDVVLGNDFLSQYLSLIPIGVFGLTIIGMIGVWITSFT